MSTHHLHFPLCLTTRLHTSMKLVIDIANAHSQKIEHTTSAKLRMTGMHSSNTVIYMFD